MNKDIFSVRIRVRYEETDRMGIVYYGNYFTWFEIARTEYFRSKGLDYKALEERDKIFLPVVEANCIYKKPLTYDDLVSIETSMLESSGTSVRFDYTLRKDHMVLAEGFTRHVFVNEKKRPVGIPETVKEIFV